ncbi:MAG: topoisomerase DNA-binding C4 zinc finger domain-containing protein, partial [Clostridia bacterium]|nr:topoisomerase DNA-binding C4 zinc finger domain-containing protein [Clostridia bacterium]
FLACPNYPECSSILPIDVKVTDVKCHECGSYMFIKKGKYGNYYECSSCGAKQPVNKPDGNARENERTEGKCPSCGKPMRRMRSKGGKIYYGCTGYPQCKFLSWDIPTGDKCPKCGKGFLVVHGKQIRCSEKDCDYSAPAPQTDENG